MCVIQCGNKIQGLLDATRKLDFLAPLAFRLFLAPIFITAGLEKALHFSDTVGWMGAEGLGLPFPLFMAFLATAAELVGGFCLLLGFAVRWMAIPLMITMIVAVVAVHWENGWFAIASTNPETSIVHIMASVGFPGAQESLLNSAEVNMRLDRINELLDQYGNYDWLTEKGSLVVLNNGIEFAVTYFIMLLSLFFTGAGRWVSVDYWIHRFFRK